MARIRRRVIRPPGATKAAGYDYAHKKRSTRDRASMPEGTPCSRCGRPMYKWQRLHLDHNDTRTGYLGLSHASCNVAASNRSPRRRRGQAVPGAWWPARGRQW